MRHEGGQEGEQEEHRQDVLPEVPGDGGVRMLRHQLGTDQLLFRFYSSLEEFKCLVCSDSDCGSSDVALDTKINNFFEDLKSVSRNMSELLRPVEDPGTFSDDQYLQTLENNVRESIKTTYFRDLKTLITIEDKCSEMTTESVEMTTFSTGDVEVSSSTVIADIMEGEDEEIGESEGNTIQPSNSVEVKSSGELDVTSTPTTEESSKGNETYVVTEEESSIEDLPLCSELSASPQLGSGLLTQFGISTSTGRPACREDPTSTTSTPPEGGLYQQLANKFGF